MLLRVRVKLNLLFTCDLFVNILPCCLGVYCLGLEGNCLGLEPWCLGLGVYWHTALVTTLDIRVVFNNCIGIILEGWFNFSSAVCGLSFTFVWDTPLQ